MKRCQAISMINHIDYIIMIVGPCYLSRISHYRHWTNYAEEANMIWWDNLWNGQGAVKVLVKLEYSLNKTNIVW